MAHMAAVPGSTSAPPHRRRQAGRGTRGSRGDAWWPKMPRRDLQRRCSRPADSRQLAAAAYSVVASMAVAAVVAEMAAWSAMTAQAVRVTAHAAAQRAWKAAAGRDSTWPFREAAR